MSNLPKKVMDLATAIRDAAGLNDKEFAQTVLEQGADLERSAREAEREILSIVNSKMSQ
jgi:hypothetical protein